MLSFSRLATRAFGSFAFLLSAAVLSHAAVITVTPTVTSLGGGIYQYAYSISNTGTSDSFLIDISVPKVPSAITMLTTPTGFTSQFDSVLGLVSFVEGSGTFGATPTSGFFFDSPDAPGTSAFTASLLDSNFNVTTFSGTTTAPILAVATPEPSFFYLLALLAPASLFLKRRKAGPEASDLETNNGMENLNVSNR